MTSQNAYTQAISEAGVSLWLDDLSRERIASGNLQEQLDTRSVVGVTTNPAIFSAALSQGTAYDEQIRQLAAEKLTAEDAVWDITTQDVRDACDVLAPIAEATDGVDGRVSLEVDPRLARETEETVAQAKELAERVGRENLMIKIPATAEGLPAISAVLAEGISVNVTLIFSLTRYREVINAWLIGLEKALDAGRDLSTIHSVASFFVSRVDTEIDKRLEASDLDAERVEQLRGRAGLANARLAYRIYQNAHDTERWRMLSERGARFQRPLWASTGTKNPDYSDTMYVTGLIAENTVNTLPEATLEAVADHGELDPGFRIEDQFDADDELLDEIARAGIDYHEVVEQLEDEGLVKFVDAWEQLLERLEEQLNKNR